MPSQNQGYREQKVKTSNPLNAQENPSLDNVTVLDKASDWLKGVIRTNQQEKNVKPIQSWINFKTQ